MVVSYQQNRVASELLRDCIRSVKAFTPEKHELWVVDNNSPRENLTWLMDCIDVNLALNRTEPLPAGRKRDPQGSLRNLRNAIGEAMPMPWDWKLQCA